MIDKQTPDETAILSGLLGVIHQKHLAIPIKFLLLSFRPFAGGLESLSYMLIPMLIKPLMLIIGEGQYQQLIEYFFVQDELGEKKLNIKALDLLIEKL